MVNIKKWWASTTIWSALGVLILAVAPSLGLTGDDAALLGTSLENVVTGALALTAIYGRVRARDRIG